MSLRSLFIAAFGILLVVESTTVWFYQKFVPETGSAYAQILMALVFFFVVLVVPAAIFFFVMRVIVTPIRQLTKAMDAFATNGSRTPLLIPRSTPKEIRALTVTFINLLERVEGAHKHSMENARVKSDFISTAAHQLRTPLTGIRWALEALEQDVNLSEEQKMLVKNAVEKSHAMVSTVGTLLDISSIESGKYRYTFEIVNIDDLLQKTEQDFRHLAQERSVTLEYKPPTKRIPSVRADRTRIQWILNNIIENAIRYTPSGGSVLVFTEMLGENMVLVRVRDTGIGIASGDRSSIFERFYRANNAISKENAGNGLGLYIARTIATDHGGDLNFAANENGVGTTFTLSLPATG